MPKRVFISYRRDDTGPAAGRIYDRLCQLVPKSNVFFDVSTIRGGEDFVRKIISEINRSDAILVFIGKRWLEVVEPADKPRIWDPNDYVRAEVRAALARPKLVLPILVGGSSVPSAEQLPEDVRALRTKSAVLLRHESFDDDAANIVAAVLGGSQKARPWENRGRVWKKLLFAFGGMVIAAILMLIGALVHLWALARPVSASIGEPMTELLLLAGLLFGTWIGWRYEAIRRR